MQRVQFKKKKNKKNFFFVCRHGRMWNSERKKTGGMPECFLSAEKSEISRDKQVRESEAIENQEEIGMFW
jgi:hypothetical protein